MFNEARDRPLGRKVNMRLTSLLNTFFLISLIIQLLHSIEELTTGFHEKWYLFKLSFRQFLIFEILFTSFWIMVLVIHFPFREYLQAFFLLLMFANGVQHLIWWGVVKKYVPGLITAFAHIALFLAFYFKLIF